MSVLGWTAFKGGAKTVSSYRNMDARRTREADRRRTREGLKVSHALPALSSSVTGPNSSAAVANE